MIGILVETHRMYMDWCRYNKINPKDYIPITSIHKVLGMKFDEVWEVKNLPNFFNDVGFVLEYLQSHDIPVRYITEINDKELK
jgi:hypothetical protein